MTYKKKLIEVALPLEDINREAAREKARGRDNGRRAGRDSGGIPDP